jgi:hypothetical protein
MAEEYEGLKETAKATQEVAKTAGKAIDAGEKLGRFIARFISGPLEQGIGIFEDKLRYMRWERQQRLMKRAEDFMREVGLNQPTRPLQLKFAVPLLQAASLEDDDYLQDLWAKLLVNAANATSGVDQKRAFVDILESLSAFDAQILEKLYSLPFEETRHKGILTQHLPGSVSVEPDDPNHKQVPPSAEVELALANLARLGVISVARSWGGGEIFASVNPTLLGKSFVQACTLRKQ